MSSVLPSTLNIPAPETNSCDILFIAGEHSGDEQASRMLSEALKLNPQLKACAFGGTALKESGVQLLYDMTGFSVVGFVEVLKNYSFFKKLLECIVNWIKTYKPKAVCFVDYPGLNLRIAERLRKEGISVKGGGNVKVLYYISPQIWAWKSHRRFGMAKCIDNLGVIFPFEPACYADTDLKVDFVGHPFISDSYLPHVRYNANGKTLLLAGSRYSAVKRIFPIMLKVMERFPNEKCVAFYPSLSIKNLLEQILKNFPSVCGRVELLESSICEVGVKAAMMSSGTMSLACSLEGIPGLIVYKANPLTYILGRLVVGIKYLSIANIILDRPAWPEFIQFDAIPRILAKRMSYVYQSQKAREETLADAVELHNVLKAPSNFSAGQWLIKNLTV